MKDLIEALTIFDKYIPDDEKYPTNCIHDVFQIAAGVDRDMLSQEDKKRLKELGFMWNENRDCWESLRFGSC